MSTPVIPHPPAQTAQAITDIQWQLSELSRKLSEQTGASLAVGHEYRQMVEHAKSGDREAHKMHVLAFFEARRQQHVTGAEATAMCKQAEATALAARASHSKEAEHNATTLASMISLYRVGSNARKKAMMSLTHEYTRLSQEKATVSAYNVEARATAEREAGDLRLQLSAVKAELEDLKRLASYQATLLLEKSSEPCAGCKRKRAEESDEIFVSTPEPALSSQYSALALKPGSEDSLLLSPILDGSYPDPPLASEQKVFSFDLDLGTSSADFVEPRPLSVDDTAPEGPSKKQKVDSHETSTGVSVPNATGGHSSEDL